MAGNGGAMGFFGKLPSVGDFVHRRLPDEFIGPWDRWLQGVVHDSRQALGEDWLDHYLVAPFWRFLLVPGVIGAQAWTGVVMPSMDRVSRYFPLTLAMPLPGNLDFAATLLGAHAWFEALEDLGAQALNPQTPMAEWDARLEAVSMPPLVLAGHEDDATIPLFAGGRKGNVVLSLSGGEADVFRLSAAMAGFRMPCSVFSGIARDEEGRVALVGEGLPTMPRCLSLLNGRWAENGWDAMNGTQQAVPAPRPEILSPVASSPLANVSPGLLDDLLCIPAYEDDATRLLDDTLPFGAASRPAPRSEDLPSLGMPAPLEAEPPADASASVDEAVATEKPASDVEAACEVPREATAVEPAAAVPGATKEASQDAGNPPVPDAPETEKSA